VTTLFTIGYEGIDIQRFVTTLVNVGIEVVADVRAIPHSRKPGFGRNTLPAKLAEVGIRYQHFLDLGDPKEGRDAAKAGDYDRFRRVFSAHLMTASAQASLLDLASLAESSSTCLLCFERNPQVCHRSIIASRLSERNMEVFDLYGDDPSRYARHAHLLPRRSFSQGRSTSK
jgi:uncharacterized protein (DUF488 family)